MISKNTPSTTTISFPWLRSLLVALGVAACGLTLPACNTTEGVGEDVRAAGDAIDDAAEDAND